MWTLGKSFRPVVSTNVRDFSAPVSYSSANRKSKRTSYDDQSISARGRARIRIFRSGGFQQDVQSGCRCVAWKMAEGSWAPAKLYRAWAHFLAVWNRAHL